VSEPQETKEQREDRVIGALCAVIEKVEGHPVRVTSYPDRLRTGESACDAIIDRGGKRVAVELEIVESFTGQMEDDARFRKVVAPVESALAKAFPKEEIAVVVPIRAIPTGIRWSKVTRDFSDGLIESFLACPIMHRVSSR
jgi:hypothetical protein